MKTSLSRLLSAVALVGVLTHAGDAYAQTAYAIGSGGATLLSFNLSSPGTTSAVTFTGSDPLLNSLDAIDFRPATGQLFGYVARTNTVYTVNTGTGALTAVPGITGTGANTFQLGMDFNPQIDRFRVVTDSTQNLVFNPNGNAAITNATALFYGANDVNAGVVPLVIENAYTNNITGQFNSTVQYAIDYGTDSLVTLANNAGTLVTVGSLGFDANEFTGFDIFTTGAGVNSAYAILNGDTSPTLYSINLQTGAATSLGAVAGVGQIYSLAITPVQVPEPGSVALALGGIVTGGALLRKRRANRN